MENNQTFHQMTNVNPSQQFGIVNSSNMPMSTWPLCQYPNGQSNANPTYFGNDTQRQIQQWPTQNCNQNATVGCWHNNSPFLQGLQHGLGNGSCHNGNNFVGPVVSIMAPIPKRRGRPRKVKGNGIGNRKQPPAKIHKGKGNESTDDEEEIDGSESENDGEFEEGEQNQQQQKENEQYKERLTPSEKKAKTMEEKERNAKILAPFVNWACTGLDLVKAYDEMTDCCTQTGKYIPSPKTEQEKIDYMWGRLLEFFQHVQETDRQKAAHMLAGVNFNGQVFDRADMDNHIYVVPKKLENPKQKRNKANVKSMRFNTIDFKLLEVIMTVRGIALICRIQESPLFAEFRNRPYLQNSGIDLAPIMTTKKLIPIGKGQWNWLVAIGSCEQNRPFEKAVCINVHHWVCRDVTKLDILFCEKICRVLKMIENGEEEEEDDPFFANFSESVKRILRLSSKGENGGTFTKQSSAQQQYYDNHNNANLLAFMPSNSSGAGASTSSEYSSGNSSSSSSSPSSSVGIQFPDHNSPFYGEGYIATYLEDFY